MNLLEIVFEKLKSIFEVRLSDFFKNNTLIFKNNSLININFSRKSNSALELNGDALLVNLDHATPEEKKRVKEEIIDHRVQIEGEAFLVKHSSTNVKKVKENLPDGTEQELLDFYKNKLTPEMCKALEASIVVRNAFRKKEDITELKRGITRKYPSWGNNLSNMVSEGYFDDYFKNLYFDMLKDENFDINTYRRTVESNINSLPFTVFVTKYKTYDALSGEVMFKLTNLKKYGTGKLLIHGIGHGNVTTALKLCDKYKSQVINIKIELNPSKTVITTTLTF